MSHKGWNDPPKVSYNSFQQSTGKKSQLTKRPDYTIDQLPSKRGTQQASSGSAVSFAQPPKSDVTLHSSASHDTTEREKEQVKNVDVLLESLNSTIARYEKHMQGRGSPRNGPGRPAAARPMKRILDDIRKRIDSFMMQWKDGKLSEPVKASMTNLVDALATDDYAKADQIHIKLMVDHISEVSQWMIGIKKLILTVRTNFNS